MIQGLRNNNSREREFLLNLNAYLYFVLFFFSSPPNWTYTRTTQKAGITRHQRWVSSSLNFFTLFYLSVFSHLFIYIFFLSLSPLCSFVARTRVLEHFFDHRHHVAQGLRVHAYTKQIVVDRESFLFFFFNDLRFCFFSLQTEMEFLLRFCDVSIGLFFFPLSPSLFSSFVFLTPLWNSSARTPPHREDANWIKT